MRGCVDIPYYAPSIFNPYPYMKTYMWQLVLLGGTPPNTYAPWQLTVMGKDPATVAHQQSAKALNLNGGMNTFLVFPAKQTTPVEYYDALAAFTNF